jgi:hypothetical protein
MSNKDTSILEELHLVDLGEVTEEVTGSVSTGKFEIVVESATPA